MKLFTSLTASAAFAQAQDFPGFGGSLADLLAQLNIENPVNLGIGAAAGNDANVNATEGEIDPITGQRYLIASGPDPTTPFENDCTGDVTNDARIDCDPCMFDPSVCNGSQAACVSTDGSGIPLGIDPGDDATSDSDDTWIYRCECDKHEDADHNDGTTTGEGWAGKECLCTACGQWDSLHPDSHEPAACRDPNTQDPCTLDPNANMILGDPNTCQAETNNAEGYQCLCQNGFYGHDCLSPLPCAANDGLETDVCNGASGTNDNDNDICVCDCTTQPDNNSGSYPTNTWDGTNCDEDICTRVPVSGGCGSHGSQQNNLTGDPSTASAVCECVCDATYSGTNCEIDDCESTSCLNGGSLDRSQGTCACSCPEGFTGANCETPTSTPTGTGCWKCDAMTYVQCATEGTFQTCSEDQSNGDNGVCFVEYREQNQQLTQLCTGCKDAKSCENLKRQNFVPGFVAGNAAPFMRMRNQCKPDYRLQVARRRYGNTQSVCRQCFSMCSNEDASSAQKCFGGLGDSAVFTAAATDDAKINAAQWIRYYKSIVGGPEQGGSPWNGGNTGSTDRLLRNGDINNNEAMVLGIPLHVTADNTNTQTVVDSPLNHIFRGFTKTQLEAVLTAAADGNFVEGVGNTYTSNPLFWTLADSTDFFWSNNLIIDQGVYDAAENTDDVFALNGYDVSKPCELDYGAGNYCDRS